jgi:hypothetical protein
MRIVILLLALSLSGCAVSGLVQEQLIKTEPVVEEHLYDLLSAGIAFQCEEVPVLMMLSPVIPLPPIIPTSWLSEDKVRIHINPKNKTGYLIGLTVKSQNGELLAKYEIPPEDKMSLNLAFPKPCKELDKSKVTITEQSKIDGSIKCYEYTLIYEKSKSEFKWGYLSA